jgi:hypothetical protein
MTERIWLVYLARWPCSRIGPPSVKQLPKAGDEEPHLGVDEERQIQNPRLLLVMQYQDVQLRESAAACSP